MELSKDVEYRPIIFIRFNPDCYENKDGAKIKSCWSINKSTGLCYIQKSKENEWNKRLDFLKEIINKWLFKNSEKTIEIIKLFYNQETIKEEIIEHIY